MSFSGSIFAAKGMASRKSNSVRYLFMKPLRDEHRQCQILQRNSERVQASVTIISHVNEAEI
jgi:hypothetical protein